MAQGVNEPVKESKGAQATDTVSRKEFLKEVMKMTGGANILECIQCGTCSGGCPTRFAMDYSPMQIIKMVNLGLKKEVLSSKTIWYCSTCHTCTTRCPREVDFSSLMMSLRNKAIKENFVKNIVNSKFHQSFFNIIYKYGKLYEPELFINILDKGNFASLRANGTLGVRLLKRGKVHMKAPSTERVPWIATLVEKTSDGDK